MKNNIEPHQSAIKSLSQGTGTKMFSVREAAGFLRISKSFLDKSRVYGNGPQYSKLGTRVIYSQKDLEEWAASTKRSHTST